MVVLAFTVAIVTALALVGVALVFRDNGSDTTSTGAAAGVDLTGISQNGAVLGEPSANVTLIVYADAQCPGCRYYAQALFPTIVEASTCGPGRSRPSSAGSRSSDRTP